MVKVNWAEVMLNMSIETWATCGALIQYDNANSCFHEIRSDPLDKELSPIHSHTARSTMPMAINALRTSAQYSFVFALSMAQDKTAQKL